MRGEVITLDLETTGLDPVVDHIIEVGIVLSRDDEIIETYQTLVNPGIPIPPKVIALTGISNDDVMRAPGIREVLPIMRQMIGSRPVVGHKVDFDLGMIERYQIGINNVPLDTYELASVLLPTAPRYSLNSIVQVLGIELDHEVHRALDDALAAWHVYRKLWHQLLEMPMPILREILDHAVSLDWNAKPAFIEAMNMRLKDGEQVGALETFNHVFTPFIGADQKEKLTPNKDRRPIDVNKIAQAIAPGGELEQKMPGYESRDSQIEMLKSVAKAFNQGDHLMIEAPTGTGKSLAYLIPAAYWAMTNNERVVISTHTINLQDQLLQKDIPLLQEKLGMDCTAADVKGRGNYLCPRRLATLRRRKPTNVDELRVLAKVLVWLGQGGNGSQTEINLRGGTEKAMWYRMTAQDEGCTLDRCRTQMKGACPFYKARVAAEQAHLLIVNHALLLADVAAGSRVLPEYKFLVLDEGHHLEDAITDGLAQEVDKYGVIRKLADLGDQKKGILGDMLQSLQDIPAEYYNKIRDYVDIVVDAVKQAEDRIRIFFDRLADVISRSAGDRTDYLIQIRVTDDNRKKRDWIEVQEQWESLSEYTAVLGTSMLKLAKALGDLGQRYRDKIEDYENLVSSVQAASVYMDAVHTLFAQFVEKPQPNTIYWVEISTDTRQVAIKAAPLNVGALVQEHLWHAKESIVLTSATLRTASSFGYIAERLGADEIKQASLPSPFDYQSSTLLYLPTDIPEPNQRKQYQEMVERGIIELATATDGRMLCLFTSYHQLRETAQTVTPRLALGNIIVYDQNAGSSRQVLLDSFKSTQKSVLMGTRSFWEGVDIPGDDLSVVVIVRLPFAVPTDPIFAARSEVYGDRSFMEYSVPDSILRFRQGFGRLIRRKSDRGVVVIMDSRIITKQYGQLFIESLPKTTIKKGRLADLPKLAQQWIDQK